MARARFKLPSVFVGCPYAGKFPFKTFRNALDRIPFQWYYADTRLQTKHLIGILTAYIKSVDYCIFDISLWNPNVALEIGLAAGLKVEYYILLNRKLSKGVPADIQGLQRIEYEDPKGFKEGCLIPRVVQCFVQDQTHPKRIRDALTGSNRDTKFYFALSVLAHFRDRKRLTHADISPLVQGTFLRREAQNEVLDTLETLGYISSWQTSRGAALRRNLFPELLKIARK